MFRGRDAELKTILPGRRPARVWTGGTREAIVRLHGGWAGAEAYWSKVIDDLERTHFVVAPELPPLHPPKAVPGEVAARDDPDSGHMRQIEQQEPLVRELRRFIDR